MEQDIHNSVGINKGNEYSDVDLAERELKVIKFEKMLYLTRPTTGKDGNALNASWRRKKQTQIKRSKKPRCNWRCT